MPSVSPCPDFGLGLDFGTSGVRVAVVDRDRTLHWSDRAPYPPAPTLAESWRQALWDRLRAVPLSLRGQVRRIAIDGTSGTVLLCDRQGHPLAPARLYNEACDPAILDAIAALTPANSPARSTTSSLAKLLDWSHTLPCDRWQQAAYLLHQADWLCAHLHGRWGLSDYHNSLKLGYDVGCLAYPESLQTAPWAGLLPHIVAPGSILGALNPAIAKDLGFAPDCQIVAGTTDSIAAFLASGAQQPGEGVTSLGSTLAIKLLSQHRVDASQYGIYSHRLGDYWLAGGASNTGGAVLAQFFDAPTLATLSQHIDPHRPTGLDYYPLLQPGERFPVNDPHLAPRLSPRPPDDATFLQGLLEAIARIEHQGYTLLAQLGATPLTGVYTAGGGATNAAWTTLRQRYLQRPIKIAASTEAAVGTAYLALGLIP